MAMQARVLAIFWGENAANGVGEPSSHFAAGSSSPRSLTLIFSSKKGPSM
jgi:hypothetical protein